MPSHSTEVGPHLFSVEDDVCCVGLLLGGADADAVAAAFAVGGSAAPAHVGSLTRSRRIGP